MGVQVEMDQGYIVAKAPIGIQGAEITFPQVTVTGTAAGTELRKIGEYDYPLPRVAAEVIYLWPERYSFDQPYWDPYWVWWPYGYYNWYGPTLRWGYYGHGHYGHGHGHGGKAVEPHAPAKR